MPRISKEAFAYKLTDEEFSAMRNGIEKGIVSFKVSQNDSVTQLLLRLQGGVALQRRAVQYGNNQGAKHRYALLQEWARKALKELDSVMVTQKKAGKDDGK